MDSKSHLVIVGGILNTIDILREQAKQSQFVLESAAADFDCATSLSRSLNLFSASTSLGSILAGRREAELFDMALKEYQYGLFAVSMGLYRQGYASLRLMLELSLSAVKFSANEMELRSWLAGRSDISWSALTCPENGVFARKFVDVFFPDLAGSAVQFRVIAEKLYRECSEFVHGNVATHKSLPSKIEFSKLVICDWCEKSQTAHELVVFAVTSRYLPDLTPLQTAQVREVIMENLGHIEAVRSCLDNKR